MLMAPLHNVKYVCARFHYYIFIIFTVSQSDCGTPHNTRQQDPPQDFITK